MCIFIKELLNIKLSVYTFVYFDIIYMHNVLITC